MFYTAFIYPMREALFLYIYTQPQPLIDLSVRYGT